MLCANFFPAAICDAGREDADDDGVCTECDFGSYKTERNADLCSSCDNGETTPSRGSISDADCFGKNADWMQTLLNENVNVERSKLSLMLCCKEKIHDNTLA